jgi:hypothetical protein
VGKKKKIRKPLDDTSGSTGTLAVSYSGQAVLRREQWECSENEHHEKKDNLQEDIESTAPEKGRKDDTPLGYSGLTALRREQCGIFAPCKND